MKETQRQLPEDVTNQPKKPHKRKPSPIQVGATVAIIGIAAMGLYEHTSKAESQPPGIQSERVDEEIIISQEIQRLGIEQSAEEQALWAEAYQYTGEELPINEQTATLAGERVYDTLRRMIDSENPYYKNAASLLGVLDEQDLLQINITTAQEELRGDAVSSDMTLEKDVVGFRLHVSPDFVLNNSDAVRLATEITHDAAIIYKMRKTWNEAPPTTPAEIEEWVKEQAQPQTLLAREAYGFGAEAEAYIRLSGLLGTNNRDDAPEPERARELAAMYIQLGMDPNSEAWRKYIQGLSVPTDNPN